MRRFQFSLRTLFAVLTLAAGASAAVVPTFASYCKYRRERARAAKEAFEQDDDLVLYELRSRYPVWTIILHPAL